MRYWPCEFAGRIWGSGGAVEVKSVSIGVIRATPANLWWLVGQSWNVSEVWDQTQSGLKS